MKTRYWIVLLSLVLLVSAAGGAFLLFSGEDAAFARIYSDGTLVRTVSLAVDQELRIPAPGGGENVVTVRDGAIAVTQATCPDHYCMHRGYCTGGMQIVCLPNRLVIEFAAEQEIDGVVG